MNFDEIPVGIRVLAVDNDPISLNRLEISLRECQYNVTTTNEARTALTMLRQNKNGFDLVISEVHLPDMDSFKLLELIVHEMDLPVIMLSANSDPKNVMKGVTHGATDYWVKPVRFEDLRNIWQHVLRKKKVDPNTHKKPRVVWDVKLHRKFVEAVNQIENSVPEKILDLMNDDRLTLENVESHLLKYRLYLKNLSSRVTTQLTNNMINGFAANWDPFTLNKSRAVWSVDRHRKFVSALNQLQIEKSVPEKILELMKDDTLTRADVESHLQKYRLYQNRVRSYSISQLANFIS